MTINAFLNNPADETLAHAEVERPHIIPIDRFPDSPWRIPWIPCCQLLVVICELSFSRLCWLGRSGRGRGAARLREPCMTRWHSGGHWTCAARCNSNRTTNCRAKRRHHMKNAVVQQPLELLLNLFDRHVSKRLASFRFYNVRCHPAILQSCKEKLLRHISIRCSNIFEEMGKSHASKDLFNVNGVNLQHGPDRVTVGNLHTGLRAHNAMLHKRQQRIPHLLECERLYQH
mmetsp:Transcript_104689/g.207994  ORF Transcript_104689/g.207994 Transcript_104689/m.207994 type:complete len:230 (-) Transcript_104689:272-961(-)